MSGPSSLSDLSPVEAAQLHLTAGSPRAPVANMSQPEAAPVPALTNLIRGLARQAAREAFAAAMTDAGATSVAGFAGPSSRHSPTETKPSTQRLESRHGAQARPTD